MKRGEVWWANVYGTDAVVLLSGGETGEIPAMLVVDPADTDIDGIAVEVDVGTAEGLPRDGVVRVAIPRPGFIPCSWLVTLTPGCLIERTGALSSAKLGQLDEALRLGGLQTNDVSQTDGGTLPRWSNASAS